VWDLRFEKCPIVLKNTGQFLIGFERIREAGLL